MATFDRLKDLPLDVDAYTLDGLGVQVGSGFERLTTVVHLQGDGLEGLGEDVVYEGVDQVAFQQAGPVHDLQGHYALGEFCVRIDSLDFFLSLPSATSRASIDGGRSTVPPST